MSNEYIYLDTWVESWNIETVECREMHDDDGDGFHCSSSLFYPSCT